MGDHNLQIFFYLMYDSFITVSHLMFSSAPYRGLYLLTNRNHVFVYFMTI